MWLFCLPSVLHCLTDEDIHHGDGTDLSQMWQRTLSKTLSKNFSERNPHSNICSIQRCKTRRLPNFIELNHWTGKRCSSALCVHHNEIWWFTPPDKIQPWIYTFRILTGTTGLFLVCKGICLTCSKLHDVRGWWYLDLLRETWGLA